MLFAGIVMLAAAGFYIEPRLPDIDSLRDIQLQEPLRVFTRDGELIAEFGEQRRKPVRYDELPQTMIDAILATEDDRFFEHPGVDYQGILRAVVELIRTGKKNQGGSTITMQVARNFFLSREKTYLRKLTEIFLALKIERYLSKQEILELYLNKIYFGHRAYGVEAAARVYYGISIQQLSIAQIATIAGLPKAPSTNNPVNNPQRAVERRDYILRRMHALHYIDSEQLQQAASEPDNASLYSPTIEVEAPYVAEMVRSYMVGKFGKQAYIQGYKVYTTLDGLRQTAANQALRTALLDYDKRHGYRGPISRIQLDVKLDEIRLEQQLKAYKPVGGLLPAIVIEVKESSARLYVRNIGFTQLDQDGYRWARAYKTVNQRGPKPASAGDVLKPGDLIRVQRLDEQRWRLAQVPQVSGALASLLPGDGALQALVGGFDFYSSKFNRAMQARRQPGSSFKPFVYSAALAKGFTTATLLNDAPVVFDDPALETAWRPENYSGKFFGPTRMREALIHSRNLVSIRMVQAIGPRYVSSYAQRFGFRADQIPKDLSLALGSGYATPWEMAGAYSVLANGGFAVKPYFIREIRDAHDRQIFLARPAVACSECEAVIPDTGNEAAVEFDASNQPVEVLEERENNAMVIEEVLPQQPVLAERVVDADNMYLLTSMMRDVIRRGTGRRAMTLGRNDLAGKTGTTNDQRDAWFCGFNADLVTTVWVGFDKVQTLGARETGGQAALPMWVDYMGQALKGMPEHVLPQPAGLVTVRIDADTGMRLPAGESGGIFELFRAENVPERETVQTQSPMPKLPTEEFAEPLF